MKCGNCGSDLKEGELFCGTCGGRVDVNFESNSEQVLNDEQIRNRESRVKESKFRDNQAGWCHVRIIGLVVMFATIWMPWVSYASLNFSSGTIDSFSGSLWELCTSYLSIGNLLYIGIFGIILSFIFTIMQKNILSIIFWLLGSTPFILILSVGGGNIHLKIGAYLAIAGEFLVIISVAMKRKKSRVARNNM